MLARFFTFLFVSQLFTNSLWYCITQQDSIAQTPIILIPVLSLIVSMVIFVLWAIRTWDDTYLG